MNRATKKAPAPATLTRADVEVTAARGHQLRDGGVMFSGLLWVRGLPVGSFHNAGEGGCCTWNTRPQYAALLAEFDALAVREFPDQKFEHRDALAGALWDVAYLKAQP